MTDEPKLPSTVSILGVPYQIVVDKSCENPKLVTANAYAELFSKKLVIAEHGRDPKTVEKIEEAVREYMRHEVIHAFFHESGLPRYGRDEELVEWIALQIRKIALACDEAEKIMFSQQVITEGESA